MERKCKSKISFSKWSKVWIAILLIWSFAEPTIISAKSDQAGSWDRGTIQQIAAGFNHSLALKSDGTVIAWGYNYYGQTTVPGGLKSVVAIAAGYAHSLALKSDGTVVAWGYNYYGQTTVPDELTGVVAIAAGYNYSLALKSDGIVVAWGDNSGGQTTVPDGLTDVVAIAAGYNYPLALKSDGTVVAWGDNYYGQTTVPVELKGVVAIAAGTAHSLALKSDGTVVLWGNNDYGQTIVPDGLTGVVAIAAGAAHSLALKSDGTVAAWGDNDDGQTTVPAGLTAPVKGKSIAVGREYSMALKSDGTVVGWGENSSGQMNVPGGLKGVVAIAADRDHSLALKSDGTVVGWGYNAYGQATVPSGLTDVVAIAAGEFHSLALKSDGTVVAWGHNGAGQTTVPGGLKGVVAIAAGGYHSLALKSDGTVVSWGDNAYGQTTVPGGLTGIVAIAAGESHSLALKSDGTVVGWGDNTYGQTTVPDGLKGVVAIAAGGYHSLALKSDGTVVGWGTNYYGQSTVPGGLTDAVAIATGGYHSLALKSDGTVVGWGYNGSGQTIIPGSAELSGLSLQEGAINPSFEPTVTEYTYSYIDPSVSDVHVTATLADLSYSALYVNNGLQTSGSVVSVPVTVPSSVVIPVRVEPYLLPGKTYTIRGGAAPTIYLQGTSPMTVEVNSSFADPGATAQDLQDGDLSSSILVTGTVDTTTLGTYTLSYDVSDAEGNAAQSVTRTVYVKDTQPPALELRGESEMRVSVGTAFTDPGAKATDAYYGDVSGLIVVTGTVDTSKAGDYTLRYNVQDPSGNAAVEVTRTVAVVEAARRGGSSAPNVTKLVIDQNGVSLNPDTIDTTKPSVTLEVTPKDGTAYVSIPAGILMSIGDKNATFFIEIQTPYGRYQVPVNLASLIPGLKNLLAANSLKAEDISFKIILTDKSGDADIQLAFASGLPNGKLMGAIVDFSMEIVNTKTKQTIGMADQFSKEMVRIIPMPKEMTDLPMLWGAFRYNETTNQFEFVPARKVQIDGIWYVMIRSYSNSVYVIADNPISFADMQQHWGQPFVRLAAAKGLVQGVGGGKYNPDQVVTRAEFAAMLVRAFGSSPSAESTAFYDDVQPDAWYYDSVGQAKELGLLGFASGKQFMPNQLLTRVEMAAMLAAAMKLKNPLIHDGSVNLNRYKDIGSLSSDDLKNVGVMVGLGIMKGTDAETFAPQSATTRTQAAIVLVKTLQALGMID